MNSLEQSLTDKCIKLEDELEVAKQKVTDALNLWFEERVRVKQLKGQRDRALPFFDGYNSECPPDCECEEEDDKECEGCVKQYIMEGKP